MTATLVVAAPRKALRHGTWTTAPESRYTVGWYGAIGWLQMRQTLTSTWVIDIPLASNLSDSTRRSQWTLDQRQASDGPSDSRTI